ncbi:MAG: hypothetical protein EOO96_25815 [Pedobacter sp.]|nr:MAG: hypothetical protein EOO96_25815 [Pedobacter sp.]
MRVLVISILVLVTQISFAQSIRIEDFAIIVMMQERKIGLSLDAYYFIDRKIPFYSISGSGKSQDGGFNLTAQTFRKNKTKEILEISIREKDSVKNIITLEMRYTAPEYIIKKMEKELLENGYKYKKKRKHYIKRNSRKEQDIVMIREHSLYVSEFDEQPEIVYTIQKRLK